MDLPWIPPVFKPSGVAVSTTSCDDERDENHTDNHNDLETRTEAFQVSK